MNPFKVVAKVGRKMTKPAAKALAKVSKNKPEIFVGAGLLMVVGSFVWVVAEAMKAPEAMTESSDKVKAVEDKFSAIREEDETRTEAECKALAKQEKKELAFARMDGVLVMSKLFGGPILLLLLGCGLIVRGHHLLRIRNAVLAATLKSTEQMFRFYRDTVIANEGEDADKKYMRGIVGETEVTTTEKDANGNDVSVTKKVPVLKKGNPWRFEFSPTFFGRAQGIPEHDLNTLQQVERYFNHLYNGPRKYEDISLFEVLMYLDPVWDAIDADGSIRQFARNYGWGHDARGDDFISLGIFEAINDAAIRGVGDAVFFECNCDGRLETLKNQYRAKYMLP